MFIDIPLLLSLFDLQSKETIFPSLPKQFAHCLLNRECALPSKFLISLFSAPSDG